MSLDLSALDATAQAELVRKGDVTAAELVDTAIARIEKLNGELNAVIIPLFEKARARARQKLEPGPFRGVPFLLKDLVATSAGDPVHSGMQLMKKAGFVAPDDSYLVRKFRADGAIAEIFEFPGRGFGAVQSVKTSQKLDRHSLRQRPSRIWPAAEDVESDDNV